jgi:2-polyprenyl-3-methyl-5-hydroxy-6-metoxy-1,4-benzoquinol methylase
VVLASRAVSGEGIAVADGQSVRERAESVGWYHTYDFGDGVVTRGFFDLREVTKKLPFPADMTGMRCIDLASSSGFFAFEMARRGGDVISLDLDDDAKRDPQGTKVHAIPAGSTKRAFETARDLLGLDVERVSMNLYDVSAEALGKFDFVFMGNVLLHLSDPGRALKGARSITDGHFLSFETISMTLTLTRPRTACAVLNETDGARWWTPNAKGHRRLMEAAEFEVVDSKFPLWQKFGAVHPNWPKRGIRAGEARLGPKLTYWGITRRIGVSSAYALCR